MSRAGSGDVITVRPTNNIYTVLVIVAFLAELLALVMLFMNSKDIFGSSVFG
jgi:hypothetical protein